MLDSYVRLVRGHHLLSTQIILFLGFFTLLIALLPIGLLLLKYVMLLLPLLLSISLAYPQYDFRGHFSHFGTGPQIV